MFWPEANLICTEHAPIGRVYSFVALFEANIMEKFVYLLNVEDVT